MLSFDHSKLKLGPPWRPNPWWTDHSNLTSAETNPHLCGENWNGSKSNDRFLSPGIYQRNSHWTIPPRRHKTFDANSIIEDCCDKFIETLWCLAWSPGSGHSWDPALEKKAFLITAAPNGEICLQTWDAERSEVMSFRFFLETSFDCRIRVISMSNLN